MNLEALHTALVTHLAQVGSVNTGALCTTLSGHAMP